MLCRWKSLPQFMQTPEVLPYYQHLKQHRFSLYIKRIVDFVLASIMLVLLVPVFLFLAVWIKLDSKGPVFYRQERVTQYGKTFRIYKFRTMIEHADKEGSLVTVHEDKRITDAGKKLRRCRLDELPQLINIWKGEMSFVGTRPEVPKYVRAYTKEMYATLLLPAGVTSKASISFKDEEQFLSQTEKNQIDQTYINNILPRKMKINLQEISTFSLLSDLQLLFLTIMAVL